MAVDEAVSEAVGRGERAPTLRFYAWKRPTVSLGALQRFPGGVSVTACRQHDIPLVRRLSGGRAVLHAAELTYSVAVPRTGIWRGSVPEAFRRLCEGLVAGLARLGIGAALGDGRPSPGQPGEGACFLLRQAPAVLAGGRKLLGSAQYRSDRAVLQQGSLLLDFDSSLHMALFPGWPRYQPAAAVTCLRELLGRIPAWELLVAALCQGWQERVGPVGAREELTSGESARASHLVQIRYGTAAWTRERQVGAGAGRSEGRDGHEP
jgi:lipoate-protein ligase A